MTMNPGRKWDVGHPRDLSLRGFEGTPADCEALARVRNLTLRPITLDEHFREFTAEDVSRFYDRPGYSLVDNAWLIYHEGEPVAAAVIYPTALFHDRAPGNFDMYVVPDHRRRHLGSRLLAHLERAAEARGHAVLETTIAKEDTGSTSFLARHGFAAVGHSLHLTRYGMDDLPPADLPPGFALRSLADLGEGPDYYIYATNRLGAYDANYSLIRPEDADVLAGSERWEPSGILFLFDPSGRTVGVIRASGEKAGPGCLHEIRLEPSLRGMGLGRAMVGTALRYLAGGGVTLTELDTPGESTAAHGLALRSGFTVTRHWLHYLKRLQDGDEPLGEADDGRSE
ncbi:MAG TPA: GNAT family N-acetyltransferase [Chloroflexia bacterium]|nr:GNAT family N-acetyltransferase [Chloroflexia bacterium]